MTAAVWVAPGRRSGDACVATTGAPAVLVAETVWWLGVSEAMDCYCLDRQGVLVACWFVAEYRRRGGRENRETRRMVDAFYDWATANVGDLWAGADVPDPPSRPPVV